MDGVDLAEDAQELGHGPAGEVGGDRLVPPEGGGRQAPAGDGEGHQGGGAGRAEAGEAAEAGTGRGDGVLWHLDD
ncbi:hypothetical protein GCM10010439_54990 [Actinocorallia aurantiaca]|uniref:Uncharacterized protein n=1 Tax=Actinocorallia aurantiaca TaxID=46204 RepID=A0ABP6GZ26_9ACTN